MSNEYFRSPLETRWGSKEMRSIFGAQRKVECWRKLWLALAKGEKELGLPITDEQIADLEEHITDIDFDAAAKYEKELRHDVMAHVHTLGDAATKARPIIHLGATSQFVNCNSELLQIRDALNLVSVKLARVIDALGSFCSQWANEPCLGFTHLQPAQPTTVGKRAATWAQDLWLALEEVEFRLATLRFRGIRGATGTQASFMQLFDNDEDKVNKLDAYVCQAFDWPVDKRFPVCGQTYPRVLDGQIVSTLAVVAAAIHKMCTDIRLLASWREVEEPFEKNQIGSSAMPFKRNPMRCERACGLTKFVMAQPQAPLSMAATQWMERTLDDSACRRMSLPEPFIATDAALDVCLNVCQGLVVWPQVVRSNLMTELPFLASENILMEAAKNGVDRQDGHEAIRKHSHEAAAAWKLRGEKVDLLEKLKQDDLFKDLDFSDTLDPSKYVGRAPQQTREFVAGPVEEVRGRYRAHLNVQGQLNV